MQINMTGKLNIFIFKTIVLVVSLSSKFDFVSFIFKLYYLKTIAIIKPFLDIERPYQNYKLFLKTSR